MSTLSLVTDDQVAKGATIVNPLWNLLENAVTETPDEPSLHTESRTYTFTEVATIARAIAAELRERGLRPGDLVATALPSAFDWFVTLAAAHEGLLSVSLHHASQADAFDCALVVGTEERLTSPIRAPQLVIDEHWIRRLEGSEHTVPARDYAGPESLTRLVLTSGTTGKPKAAEYSVHTFNTRIEGMETAMGSGGASRINLMGFSSMGGLYSGMMHLWSKTPFIAVNAITDRLPHLMRELSVAVVVGATTSIAQLIRAYTDQQLVDQNVVRVLVAGSTPSEELLNAISTPFPSAQTSIMYGSTEAGLIAVKDAASGDDPRNVGHPLPGVVVNCLDESGDPCGHNVTGEIRYRSPELIQRYFHDPEATADAIRDGWFYPGDRGFLTESGELVITGRIDDVINIGGNKVDPLTLDLVAETVDGVDDAAAFVYETENGAKLIAMAVVSVNGHEILTEVDRVLRQASPLAFPTTYFMASSLPYNQMGKLLRSELRLP